MLNNSMNKYISTVRVKGQAVKTAVFADSSLHAHLILEYQFGIGSIIRSPSLSSIANVGYTPLDEVISKIKSIKPMTPPQARIDSLKKQKDALSNNLKIEREKQKVERTQQ